MKSRSINTLISLTVICSVLLLICGIRYMTFDFSSANSYSPGTYSTSQPSSGSYGSGYSSNSAPETPFIRSTVPPGMKDTVVYVTRSGDKYHLKHCQYLSQSCKSITLEKAVLSYGPCTRCNPPH